MGRHVLYTPNLSVSTPASFVAARHLKPFPAGKERTSGMRTIDVYILSRYCFVAST